MQSIAKNGKIQEMDFESFQEMLVKKRDYIDTVVEAMGRVNGTLDALAYGVLTPERALERIQEISQEQQREADMLREKLFSN